MGGVCSTGKKQNVAEPLKAAKMGASSSRRLSVTSGPSPAGISTYEPKPGSVALGPTDIFHGEHHDAVTATLYCAKSLAGKSDVRPRPVFKENQDDFIAVSNIRDTDVSLYAALDGHGRSGALASAYVKSKLIDMFNAAPEDMLLNKPADLFKQVFDDVDEDLNLKSGIDVSLSGTTLVMAWKLGNEVVCANAGDSRCVLGYVDGKGKIQAKDISHDHKPENPEEIARIEKMGGQVEPMHDHLDRCVGPHRVWVADEMTPGLAMSRSIGDAVAHSVGVSHIPEITRHTLNMSTDRFMVLCSDGVWEFIESQEACEMVSKCGSPAEAADVLIAESVKRWEGEEEVVDDITALVLFFSDPNADS